MSDFDWKTFVTRVPVNAPVEKLYWCWATREGIEFWFLRMSDYKRPDGAARQNDEYVQKGDSYAWRWHGWSDEVTEVGKILDCNGRDFFKFSFGKAGNCAVSIKNENGQNILELIQEEIPDDEQGRHYWHLGCKTGWTFYLANLKSLLEGGIDLRNRDEGLKSVINS
ncbi:MAG: SRPBCC domain-containing protein [Chitinophagaceae bacterium]